MSNLKFRVREYPKERYKRPPLVTDQVFNTYKEALKVAEKYGASVEPHFEPQKVGKYDLIDFECGQQDIDQSKLRTKKTIKNKKR